MQPVTVGMIGLGGWGACRRGLMRQSGTFRIAAVCDRNGEVLGKAAAEENATPYTDYETLLGHPGLEGVVISTGADSHADLAIRAMRRGLHVFVQKRLRGPVEEREPVPIPAGNPAGAYANLLSWRDGIRKGSPVYPGLEDGINAVLPVFAAEAAEREGNRVILSELVEAARLA